MSVPRSSSGHILSLCDSMKFQLQFNSDIFRAVFPLICCQTYNTRNYIKTKNTAAIGSFQAERKAHSEKKLMQDPEQANKK